MGIIAVALLDMLNMVRLTKSMLLVSFIDALMRKVPDMFAVLIGCIMVLFGGCVSMVTLEMFTIFWLPAKSVAFM